MTTSDLDCPSTGRADIDDQHDRLWRQLRTLVDDVNAGSAPVVRQRLSVVIEQVEEHFAFEDRLMAASAFSNLARHREAHSTFVADLRKFEKELAAKGITPNFRRWAVSRLLEWFRFHVVANDIELAKHLARGR